MASPDRWLSVNRFGRRRLLCLSAILVLPSSSPPSLSSQSNLGPSSHPQIPGQLRGWSEPLSGAHRITQRRLVDEGTWEPVWTAPALVTLRTKQFGLVSRYYMGRGTIPTSPFSLISTGTCTAAVLGQGSQMLEPFM